MKRIVNIIVVFILGICIVSCKKEPLIFKSKKVDLEYGDMVSENLEDYINIEQSDQDVLKKVKLDLSQIKKVKDKNYPELGIHILKIGYDDESYEIEINVKDTKSPVFEDFNSTLKFVKGQKSKKKELLKSFKVTDVDSVNIVIDDSQVNYDKEGEYKATVCASDSTNNKTIKNLKIFIVKPAVQFVNNQVELKLWDRKKLPVKVNTKNGKVNYRSTDRSIISVNKNGVVTAKRKGTATVIATVNGEEARCKITVSKPNITNSQHATKYLLNYLKANGKSIPSFNEFEYVSEYGYVIHGYNMGLDFTFTSYWYAISKNGDIYDEMLFEYVYKS